MEHLCTVLITIPTMPTAVVKQIVKVNGQFLIFILAILRHYRRQVLLHDLLAFEAYILLFMQRLGTQSKHSSPSRVFYSLVSLYI